MNCHYVHSRCDKSSVDKFFTDQKTSLMEHLSVTTWEIDGCLFNPFNIAIKNTFLIQWLQWRD